MSKDAKYGGIRATDDPELAKSLGFTDFDDERGQFVPPAEEPEDGEDNRVARRRAAKKAAPAAPEAPQE